MTKFTTTTTLPILATLVVVFGISSMVVMVQAQGCSQRGFSNPATNPADPVNQCEMNQSCCDGELYCKCGNNGFVCAIDDRGASSALSCVAWMKSMNDTTTVDDPDIIVTEKDADSSAGSSNVVLMAMSLVTAMGGIALL